MTTIDPSWAETLRDNPSKTVDAIIRTADTEAVGTYDWNANNLQLRHTYNLVPGAAVTGPARAVLALADEPWVTRVEPDRDVQTMS